ncbi:aldo/keto reductase [Hymenobacter sp. 5516J-16]|uniref:aldo/keto reductase n=1 Tax=Hymenobacter sp. 5516J-16 TaxID=2932253 RepID=UPI001FD47DC7|nr:aldo/keto reductase [Hymenobacter sp. 5516J-16]UOQ77679.1 aldo/keto reductase [Hymenobacter sp. 5516J-16]
MISLEQLSPLGIGTSRVASLGSRLAPAAFAEMLQVAAEREVNLIDTADFYGSGDAERLIRKGIKATGKPFFVVTKAGQPYVHTPGWLSPLNQLAKKVKQRSGAKNNYTSAYLIRSVQKSNQRLGVEAADALLLHEPTWHDIAHADPWEGLATIRKQGLARYTGVSSNDYRVVEAGLASGQVQLVQTTVSWRRPNPIVALCQAHGVPVLANMVLQPFSALQPTFARQATAVQQLPGLTGLSLAQLLIGAVLAEKQADIVLFGTSSLGHLQHNMEALRYLPSLPAALPHLHQLLA